MDRVVTLEQREHGASAGANKFRRHMQMAPMLSNFAQRTLEQEQLWNGIYHPEGERTNDASFSP